MKEFVNAAGLLAFLLLYFLASGCTPAARAVTHAPAVERETTTVCLQLAAPEDIRQAKRGVEWWGTSVVYTCPGMVTVQAGPPHPDYPLAFAYYDHGTHTITHTWGRVDNSVKHEFGHYLRHNGHPHHDLQFVWMPQQVAQ